jgi:Zn-dependent peptidase ImmA (M78 family)
MAKSPEELAADVLDWYSGEQTPGVNVVSLAGALGVAAIRAARIPQAGRLDWGDSGPTIYVKATQTAPRRRFTIAHELGHLLLATRGGVPLERQRTEPALERYCDRFASALLLPGPWLEKQCAEHGAPTLRSIGQVAQKAAVSASATYVALERTLPWWNAALIRWRWDVGDRRYVRTMRVRPRDRHGRNAWAGTLALVPQYFESDDLSWRDRVRSLLAEGAVPASIETFVSAQSALCLIDLTPFEHADPDAGRSRRATPSARGSSRQDYSRGTPLKLPLVLEAHHDARDIRSGSPRRLRVA